jgi:hypothetical protein
VQRQFVGTQWHLLPSKQDTWKWHHWNLLSMSCPCQVLQKPRCGSCWTWNISLSIVQDLLLHKKWECEVHLNNIYISSSHLTENKLRLRYRDQPINAVWGNSRCLFENRTEHTDTVRTSQETHYVSATEPNRVMLFGETVAVYCENHMEHTDTVRTSQQTHYVSATEPNRLMLFG